MTGVDLPHKPERGAGERADLAELAVRAAHDPTARAFVEEVKAAVADGSIRDQLSTQTDLRGIIEEHSR
jgi:hypothetical protein